MPERLPAFYRPHKAPRKTRRSCLCGLNEWKGDGPAETVTIRTDHSRSKKTLQGYRETCQECGSVALVDDDGEPLHFMREP